MEDSIFEERPTYVPLACEGELEMLQQTFIYTELQNAADFSTGPARDYAQFR